MAPDPNRRFDAAQAVFKSRDAAALPALDKALAAEKNARVKKAMSEAHAAIVLAAPDSKPADKIAAIEVIRDRGDQDALGLVNALAANQPPEVQAAAVAARAKIQRTLAIWNTVQNAWYGLSLGSVLLLGGDRACHHLRRDGRHQHGAWRDGDARRLRHLRRAGADPHL